MSLFTLVEGAGLRQYFFTAIEAVTGLIMCQTTKIMSVSIFYHCCNNNYKC